MLTLRFLAPFLICSTFLASCGGAVGDGAAPSTMSAAAQLGALIFKDVSLSASGAMSCETCHDPRTGHGHASPFDTPVAFGGDLSNLPFATRGVSGLRVPPAINYLKFNGAFKFAADGTPMGGFFWDGRKNSLAEQAEGPLLGAAEMANGSRDNVISKLRLATYADQFKAVFGANIFNDPNAAFDRLAYALERYQVEDTDFAPFTSKFDAAMQGKEAFTPEELRGLAWFNRADKGNCAACHPSTKPDNAPAALFTDFSYDSLGVPRNDDILANRQDANFFDKGLCGPVRTDLSARTDLCGAFKVPSLRNVALRKRFFHNGKFATLAEVVDFYITRDTNPTAWYPTDPLNVLVYNDLPALERVNVNVAEGPYNRRGQAPALNAQERTELIAFLSTLSDR
jgi:cytochrome c peroxidase